MKRISIYCLLILCVSLAASAQRTKQLTILHTSDTHSRIEPIDSHAADQYAGMGGVVRRATFLKDYRAKHPDVLLFDFGLDNMARLFRMADFPVVCANYDVTGTVLEGLVKPYVVLNRNGMKIGVFGLSPKMEGLVQADKCEGIVYNDPIAVAQKIADRLRTKEGCDVVVCLSHLGFRIKNGVCDEKLAAETKGIDVILGGHSHTFMEKPAFFLNAEGKSIPVLHTGKNGIFVGELDLTLSEEE